MSLAFIRRFEAVLARKEAVGRHVRVKLISSSSCVIFLTIISLASKADGFL